MPGNDLCAAQGSEPRILPVRVVVADQEGDAAKRRVEHFDVRVAGRENLLVLRIEAVLAVLADDAAWPHEHGRVVGEARFDIALSDTDANVQAGPLENGQQRGRGPTGNGVEKGRNLIGPAE